MHLTHGSFKASATHVDGPYFIYCITPPVIRTLEINLDSIRLLLFLSSLLRFHQCVTQWLRLILASRLWLASQLWLPFITGTIKRYSFSAKSWVSNKIIIISNSKFLHEAKQKDVWAQIQVLRRVVKQKYAVYYVQQKLWTSNDHDFPWHHWFMSVNESWYI